MAERPGLWSDVDRYFDTVVDWRCPHCRVLVRLTRRELRTDELRGPRQKHLETLECRRTRAGAP